MPDNTPEGRRILEPHGSPEIPLSQLATVAPSGSPRQRQTNGVTAVLIIGGSVLAAGVLTSLFSSEGPTKSPEVMSASAAAVSTPQLIVDVPAIAGKRPAEVDAALGPPSSADKNKYDGHLYPRRYYQDGKVEITFIGGKAEWITVSELGNLPFSADALPALGMDRERFASKTAGPSVNTEHLVRWDNGTYPGFHSVYLFSDGNGGINYAYFTVTRNP